MIIPPRSRRGLRRLIRRVRSSQRPILAVLVVLFLLDVLLLVRGRPPTARAPIYTLAQRAAAANTTVFIASVHRNTETILAEAWSDAVIHLASVLGPSNVYFSAVESGSQDKTKDELTQLKGRLDALGVSNTVTLGMTLWEQIHEIEDRPAPDGKRPEGWIWDAPESRYDLRRIPYLSRERNRAMQPLEALEAEGRRFDKILWVNDVVFDTEDVLNLLDTHDGHYAAACSMDFKQYPYYYDTFALRDDHGDKTASHYWPWFMSPTARASARRGDPVRVFACWNGMVAFAAAPWYANPPLRFRGVPDSLADWHLEASECCLIHADNPLSAGAGPGDAGVWLNPNVRVGYSVPAYAAVKGGRFPRPAAAVAGAWANRWLRFRMAFQIALEDWTVRSRLLKWRAETPAGEPPRIEPGEPCLINEMQIMWQNGWKHL